MRLLLLALLLIPVLAFADADTQFVLDRSPTLYLDPETANTERAPIVHITAEDNAASTVVLNKANAALAGTANRNTNAWSTASGKITRGFDFYNGGTADKIDLGADVIAANGEFTFCAWVRLRTAGAPGRLFSGAGADSVTNASGVVTIFGGNSPAGVWVADEWVHLVIQRIGDVGYLWKNGAAVLSVDATGATGATGRYIGNRADNARHLDGIMDDIRIYNYALTPSQIQAIYNAGAGHQRIPTRRHTIATDTSGAVTAITDHQNIEFFQSTAASRPQLTRANAPTEGLLVHIKAEDNAASTVVTNSVGTNGTANRNTNAFSTASGKIGRGFDFYNGSTADKIDLGADVIAADQDFTVCLWFQADSHGGTGGRILASSGDTPTLYAQSTGQVVFYITGPENVGLAWSSGNWYNFCMLRAANKISVYNNGAFIQELTTSTNSALFQYIGNRAADDRYFDGIVDDIRIYNRALDIGEIKAIYNEGAGIQELRKHLNGRRVLVFDGTDDRLTSEFTSAAIVAASARSIFALTKHNAASGNQFIFGDEAGRQGLALNYYASGNKFFATTNDSGAKVTPGITATTNTTLHLHRHDGTITQQRANGAGQNFVASGAMGAVTSPLSLGALGSSTYPMGGTIGPIIAFNRVLPESDLLTIEQGLARKYAVSLAAATAEVPCDQYIASLTPTLWLRSDDLSTITKGSDNKVSEWASRVGAITFAQATAGRQPVWTGDGVQFTAASSTILTSTATIGDAFANNAKTTFWVAKSNDITTATSRFVLGSSWVSVSENLAACRSVNHDGSTDLIDSGTNTVGTSYVCESTHDGTNMTVGRNGGTPGTTASGNTSNITAVLSVGGFGASFMYEGKIQELITDNSVWTADQRARVRSCLGQRYGVSF